MKKIVTFLTTAALFGAATYGSAAETVHLYLKGSKTTSFNPEVPSGGILATIENPRALFAREGGSGLATGRRQYQPLIIRKRIDKSSPILAKALVDNEVIKEAKINFYRPAGPGKVRIYRTATLTNVRIQKQTPVATTGKAPEWEDIMFIFGKLEFKNIVKVQSVDDWAQLGAA